MDNELDLGRYTASLRRSRKFLAVVALVGALLGAFAAKAQPQQATVSLKPVGRGAELAVAGIELGTIDVQGKLQSLASELAAAQFEDDVREAIGDDIDVMVVGGTPPKTTIEVTVSASSADQVRSAIDAVVTRGQQFFADDLALGINVVKESVEIRLTHVNDRLAELQAEISAAKPEQEFLVEGLLAQVQRAKAIVDDTNEQLLALDSYVGGLAAELRVVGESEPAPARGTIALVIAGLVVGAVLGIAAVLVRALLDQRIRSRRDLSRIGLVDLVGVLGRTSDGDDVQAVAAAIEHLFADDSYSLIQIVDLGTASATTWYAAVESELAEGHSCVLVDTVGHAAASTAVNTSGTLNILALPWGQCHRASVISAANRLSAAGSVADGVILYDVPESELKSIEA